MPREGFRSKCHIIEQHPQVRTKTGHELAVESVLNKSGNDQTFAAFAANSALTPGNAIVAWIAGEPVDRDAITSRFLRRAALTWRAWSQ